MADSTTTTGFDVNVELPAAKFFASDLRLLGYIVPDSIEVSIAIQGHHASDTGGFLTSDFLKRGAVTTVDGKPLWSPNDFALNGMPLVTSTHALTKVPYKDIKKPDGSPFGSVEEVIADIYGGTFHNGRHASIRVINDAFDTALRNYEESGGNDIDGFMRRTMPIYDAVMGMVKIQLVDPNGYLRLHKWDADAQGIDKFSVMLRGIASGITTDSFGNIKVDPAISNSIGFRTKASGMDFSPGGSLFKILFHPGGMGNFLSSGKGRLLSATGTVLGAAFVLGPMLATQAEAAELRQQGRDEEAAALEHAGFTEAVKGIIFGTVGSIGELNQLSKELNERAALLEALGAHEAALELRARVVGELIFGGATLGMADALGISAEDQARWREMLGSVVYMVNPAQGTDPMEGIVSRSAEYSSDGASFVETTVHQDNLTIKRYFSKPDSNSSEFIETKVEFYSNSGTLIHTINLNQCFPAGTQVTVPGGGTKAIECIRVGDLVLAFDGTASRGQGQLVPRRVSRLFSSATDVWFVIRAASGLEGSARAIGFSELTVTPGHHFLDPLGRFRTIEQIMHDMSHIGRRIVLADGAILRVTAEVVRFSEETASRYEAATFATQTASNGLAHARTFDQGWKTYNIEVEDFHTYVAEGIRVHNDSILDFLPEGASLISLNAWGENGPSAMTYRRADGAVVDVVGGETNGLPGTDRVQETVQFANTSASYVQVRNFAPDGAETSRRIDSFEFSDQIIQGEDIGRIFGSSLGNAIAEHVSENVFARIGIGTVLGTATQNIGELVHKAIVLGTDWYGNDGILSDSPFEDALGSAFGDAHTDFFVNLKSAGLGAISSLLTAELAESLGISGDFGGQLFTVAGESVLSTALTNVSNIVTTGSGSIFDGFGGLLFNVDPSSGNLLAGNLTVGVSAFIGGYLAKEVYAPKTIGGSLGGAVGGAIGSYIGSTVATAIATQAIGSLVAGILLPGIGAFFGTIIGTFLGDWLNNTIGDSIANVLDDWFGIGGASSFNWNMTTTFDNPNDRLLRGALTGEHEGDMAAVPSGMANRTIAAVREVLRLVGGDVTSMSAPRFYFAYQASANLSTVKATGAGKTFQRQRANAVTDADINWATEQVSLAVLKAASITPDPVTGISWQRFTTRAIKHSNATTIERIALQAAFAQVYGKVVAQVLNFIGATGAVVPVDGVNVNFYNYKDFDNLNSATKTNFATVAEKIAVADLTRSVLDLSGPVPYFVDRALRYSTATTVKQLNLQLSVAKGYQDFYDQQLKPDLAPNADNLLDRLHDLGLATIAAAIPDFNTVAVTLPAEPVKPAAGATAAQMSAYNAALATYKATVSSRIATETERQIVLSLKAATVTGDAFVIDALRNTTATTVEKLGVELAVAKGFQNYYSAQLVDDNNPDAANLRDQLVALGVTSISAIAPDYATLRVALPVAPANPGSNATAEQTSAYEAAFAAHQAQVDSLMSAAVDRQIVRALKHAMVAGDIYVVGALQSTNASTVAELFAEISVARTYSQMLDGFVDANGVDQPGLRELIGGQLMLTTPNFAAIPYDATWTDASFEAKVLAEASKLLATTIKAGQYSGLDLLMARWREKTTSTTFEQMKGEVIVSKDFATYLANKPLIDRIISETPDTAFSAGWIITLQKAEELGLSKPGQVDFTQGFAGFLKNFGLDGARAADLSISLDGNTLRVSVAQGGELPPKVIELSNYTSMTGLALANGSLGGAQGTAGRDLWIGAPGPIAQFYGYDSGFIDSSASSVASHDLLIGTALSDGVDAGAGDDVVLTGDGNDTIDAGTGDDIIVGGRGNDNMTGRIGNDTYIVGRGSGVDTINNGDATGNDKLVYARSVVASDLWFQTAGTNASDLKISILGSTDTVTLSNWFADPGAMVDEIDLSDGSKLVAANVNQLINAMASFSPSTLATNTDGSIVVPESVKLAITSAWQASA